MTDPSRILWSTVFVAAALLLPSRAAAQNFVAPTVKPTPPGQFIVVNNSPGDQTDPHVSGELVSYSNNDGTNFTIRYFDLVSLTDKGVPNSFPFFDFLAAVRGSTIAFTRVSPSASAIFKFDTSNLNAPPVELAPQSGSERQAAQIGDQAIAWQDFSGPNGINSFIAAYDRQTGTVIRLDVDPFLNQSPAISPDGTVIVWEQCANVSAPCSTWKAVLANGTWTAQQVVSQVGGAQTHPDTDGTIIAYSSNFGTGDQLVWQPVSGGIEQVLNLQGGQGSVPSISGGPQNSLMAFAYRPAGAQFHDIAVYNPATNVLYDVTKDAQPGNNSDRHLNDISVTPDGKVRVVWDELDSNFNVYAYTFNLPVGDFSFSPIAPLTISAGGSGSANVTANPVNGFSSAVNLSVTGQPAGVSAPLSANSVTPSGGTSATSVLSVSVADFVTPTNFTLTVTGISGSLSHSTAVDVTVIETTTSLGNFIGDLGTAGCVDPGVENALLSKVSAAQSAGNVQTEINTLTALKNQINAQAGKHIATACTVANVALNPVTVLLLDVQSLIDTLRVGLIADPITGYVVNSSGVGVPGATVSILDAGSNVVATATSDITGFYFFAIMSVLTPNASYTVAVTGLPPGFVNVPPPSPAFIWSGSGVMIGKFVLN